MCGLAGIRDDDIYNQLMKEHPSFLPTHFEQIGKWKDGAQSDGRWRENVASVAFLIWKQAADLRPQCPPSGGVKDFLEGWMNRKYTDHYESGMTRAKRFGLSRATTLLHFLSKGAYPIFDSRVRTAVSRLSGEAELSGDSVDDYLDEYCPFYQSLAKLCGTQDHRQLDKALFVYGQFSYDAWLLG